MPLGRLGTPEDVAAAYLALIDMQHVTGQVIVVDGGATISRPSGLDAQASSRASTAPHARMLASVIGSSTKMTSCGAGLGEVVDGARHLLGAARERRRLALPGRSRRPPSKRREDAGAALDRRGVDARLRRRSR